MRYDSIRTFGSSNTEQVRNGIPRPVEAVVVSICIVIMLPLLILLSLAVALSSPGPVIFRQSRVGRHGGIFTLYKFRTMIFGREGLQVTAADDARVTRFGRILRRTKLDEFPEFWNVLRGDMSLVGPRPEVPRYVNLEDKHWRQVLLVRPGLTDPMTISMLNEEELLSKVTTDRERYYLEQLQPYKIEGQLEYLRKRSWKTDLSVLLRTSLTLILRHNTSKRFEIPDCAK